MSNKMELIELEEFIKNALLQIERGADIGKRSFKDAIEFEVSISKIEKIGGNVKIYVAQGEKEISKESLAKIKFQIISKYPEETFNDFNTGSDRNFRIGV